MCWVDVGWVYVLEGVGVGEVSEWRHWGGGGGVGWGEGARVGGVEGG